MNSAVLGDRLSLSGIDCLCPIFPLFVPLTDSSVPDWGRPAQKSTNLTGLHVWGFWMAKTEAFCLDVEKMSFETFDMHTINKKCKEQTKFLKG